MQRKIIALMSAGGAALAVTAGSLGIGVPGASAAVTSAPSVHRPHSHSAAASEWVRDHRRAIARVLIEAGAQAIGISPQSLVSALRSGESIADVAKAHNVQPQRVADALVAAAHARISNLERKGRITAAQAARLGDRVDRRIPQVITHHFR
jgi:hypothetical protein